MSDSSLQELLSVTDKAVKALNKSNSSRSSQSSVASVKSDRSHTKDSGIKTQTENVDQHTSDISDVSTTASDVLIKSTIIENEEKHNSSSSGAGANGSNESKCSRTSIGIDNFNTSGPQKVKISTKKLREIKSPLGGDLISPRSNTSSPPVISQTKGISFTKKASNVQENPLVTRHFKTSNISKTEKLISPRDFSQQITDSKPVKHVNKPTFPSAKHGTFHEDDNFSSNKTDDPSYDKPSVGVKLQNGSTESSDDSTGQHLKSKHETMPSSDKGSSDDREIIIERHAPKITKPTLKRLVDDDEDERVKRKLKELEDSIELIPQKETVLDEPENSSYNSSRSVEIVTVPERIVTVSARTSLSTENSYHEEEGERIPPRLISKFQPAQKLSSHLLRQGAPVEGMEFQDRQKQSADVQISHFTQSDRQKIKESLAKRQEHAGPIKRVVQPKFVNHQKSESSKKTEPTTNQADSVTASVAASVAVAATAPFLKAQQELEARMKDMLEKVSVLHSTNPKPISVEEERIKELERQVASLTEQRIQHLEKLQEHQVAMQAKLLSTTRSAPKRRATSPETPIHSPSIHRRPGISDFGPKRAFSKTTVHRPKSTSPTRSEHGRARREDPCESPFDTPNPRSKAPKPVAYDSSMIDMKDPSRPHLPANNHKSRGILEEILASAESPRHKSPSPQPQTQRSPYNGDLAKSPVLRKAERLVHDLSGINDDVKSVVSEIDRCKELEQRKRQITQKKEELLGPSPLDAYLISSSSSKEFTTPYKSVPELSSHHFNAPLPPGFSDAEQVLSDVTKTRAYLEANLQTVLRSRQEAEVYNLLENLYHDSSDPERAHLQQKVDKWVAKLRQQVEKEITDDVVIAEMQKAHLPLYKVPPPPTIITQTAKSVGRGRGIPSKPDSVLSKPRQGARIDTGLGRRPFGKENKPDPPRPSAQRKPRAQFEDEEYMTRVYGKASYQGKRTTTKDPYLHYRNEPKPKPERPIGAVETAGQTVKSVKSQTSAGVKQFYFSPTHGTYIPIKTDVARGPIPGNLVPMAVPLGGPRMEGGLTAPVTRTTAAGPVTSTPVSRTQVTADKNVTLVSIPAEESFVDRKSVPELSKQVLPNVDIDTDLSEMSGKLPSKKSIASSKTQKPKSKREKSPKHAEKPKDPPSKRSEQISKKRSVELPSPQQSPTKAHLEAAFSQAVEDEDGDITEVSEVVYDDDFSPESAPGMELPGYHPPSPPPHREPGPSFPPNIPGQEKIMAASDVIAEDIKRREMVENNAVEWVEQELMARVISQMATQRKIEPPQISHFVDEVEESVSSDHDNSMFLMDALGHTGLQLFVDAGKPVDSTLVNTLIKECLMEKVVGMLGQKPDDQGTGMSQARTDTKMSTVAAGVREQEEMGYVREDEFGQRQIRTPQPTPKSSPVMSPVRMQSLPYTPPASPPIDQEVPVTTQKQHIVVQPEYESEISESVDISEEIRLLQGQLSKPEQPMPTREIHDVVTPVPTPVPEEVVEEKKPVSPPPPTPRQEVVVPKVQPQLVELPKEAPREVPEVVKEAPVEPTSPEPWGNPDSPIPEENPNYQEDYLDHPEPIVMSAVPTDDMVGTQTLQMPVGPPSPKPKSPVPERQPSPALSDDTTTLESTMSDTVNQSVSMGQWLLSKSEGEVADYILDDDLKQRIAKSSKNKGDASVADTLRDTTELVDESVAVSEGEFQHRTNLSPEKDPVLNFIASLQTTPQVKQAQYDMPYNQVYDVLNQTGKSMGEISMRADDDRRYYDQGYYQYRDGHSPTRRSMDRERRLQERDRRSPGYMQDERDYEYSSYRDRGHRSPTYRESRSPTYRESRSPVYGERESRSPVYRERDTRSPIYVRESRSPTQRDRETRSPTQRERGNRSPTQRERQSRSPTQKSTDYGRRTKSPMESQEFYSNGLSPQGTRQFSPQGTRQSFNSEFSTQESMRGSDFKKSSVEFNDTPQILSGSRQKNRRQTPSGGITVTPGIMAGGRSPLKSAMRKPPQVQKSWGQPDRSISKNQHQVVEVRSSDHDLKDSLEASQNLYGFNSTQDQRSSRAYTPDQMNLDALVQSGYLTQSLTYSADLGQSGNMSQSMDRSTYKDSLEYRHMSPRRTEKGQSLGLTYSFEEEDDFVPNGDLEGTGTLKMSVTLPSFGATNEESELSEIDITDGNTR